MKKFLVFLLVLSMATAAFAAKPVNFVFSEDITYDDNIYLKSKNKQGAGISITRLGANYKTNIPDSSLKLTARGNVAYRAYTKDPSKNNFWDTLGAVQVQNDWLTVGDMFIFTSDPANNEQTENAERINNIAYLSLKTSEDKLFGFGITVDDSYIRYMESEWEGLNRNRLNMGLQLFYNISSKTNIFAEYVFSDISYEENKINESQGSSLSVGVNGKLTSSINGTAKVIWDMRDYDYSVQGVSNYKALLGYYAALEWRPTNANMVRLSGQRRMEETLYGNNRYFTNTLLSLSASQKMYERWTASLTVAWENMDYPYEVKNTKRQDNLYTVRPALDYQFKQWLSAGVWYQFRTRRSNANGSEYDSNKMGVLVKATF